MSSTPYPADPAYEVRFGLVRRDLLLIPASAVFLAVGILWVGEDPLIGVAGMLLGGGYLAVRLITALSRRVALRVDVTGVTLGAVPPWPRTHIATVPWSDIEAVVLWRQVTGRTSVRYLGLQRRAGLAPLPGSLRSGLLKKMTRSVVPRDVPLQTAIDSRPVSLWRLDEKRLAEAIDRFGTGVELVRAG
jgi:hypothetical protein